MQVVEAKPYDQLDGTFYKAKITHVRWCVISIIAVLECILAKTSSLLIHKMRYAAGQVR